MVVFYSQFWNGCVMIRVLFHSTMQVFPFLKFKLKMWIVEVFHIDRKFPKCSDRMIYQMRRTRLTWFPKKQIDFGQHDNKLVNQCSEFLFWELRHAGRVGCLCVFVEEIIIIAQVSLNWAQYTWMCSELHIL